jgi:anti-sigma factor RsiW
MDCQQAQRLFDDLGENRLPEPAAREVHRHLDECTDCRVAHQRAARLQRLLALKRHEQPGPAYFDSFLDEFHRRLDAETAPRASWWERVRDSLTLEPAHTWRYTLAGAAAVVLVVGSLTLRSLHPVALPVAVVAPPPVADSSPVLVASESHPASHTAPRLVNASYTGAARGIDAESAALVTPGGIIIMPTAARRDQSPPRYVLDRLTVTPASYETASIHF